MHVYMVANLKIRERAYSLDTWFIIIRVYFSIVVGQLIQFKQFE